MLLYRLVPASSVQFQCSKSAANQAATRCNADDPAGAPVRRTRRRKRGMPRAMRAMPPRMPSAAGTCESRMDGPLGVGTYSQQQHLGFV